MKMRFEEIFVFTVVSCFLSVSESSAGFFDSRDWPQNDYIQYEEQCYEDPEVAYRIHRAFHAEFSKLYPGDADDRALQLREARRQIYREWNAVCARR